MEKILYAELTPAEFRVRLGQAPIAYLPLGTLEWHGEHLPLGADGVQSSGFFEMLARRVGGIVLPMLFLGPDRFREADGRTLYGMDFCTNPPDKRYPDGALRPELVRIQNLPGDPQVWPVAINGQDPRIHASSELGRGILEKQAGRMAELLLSALKD